MKEGSKFLLGVLGALGGGLVLHWMTRPIADRIAIGDRVYVTEVITTAPLEAPGGFRWIVETLSSVTGRVVGLEGMGEIPDALSAQLGPIDHVSFKPSDVSKIERRDLFGQWKTVEGS